MRNLRKIFESLGMFKRDPALAIKDAFARVLTGDTTPDDITLLTPIIEAVIAIAENDAKARTEG
jgi:hypothetical protein